MASTFLRQSLLFSTLLLDSAKVCLKVLPGKSVQHFYPGLSKENSPHCRFIWYYRKSPGSAEVSISPIGQGIL